MLIGYRQDVASDNRDTALISVEDWECIKETVYLMGDPDFMKDVKEARNTPDSEFEAWN